MSGLSVMPLNPNDHVWYPQLDQLSISPPTGFDYGTIGIESAAYVERLPTLYSEPAQIPQFATNNDVEFLQTAFAPVQSASVELIRPDSWLPWSTSYAADNQLDLNIGPGNGTAIVGYLGDSNNYGYTEHAHADASNFLDPLAFSPTFIDHVPLRASGSHEHQGASSVDTGTLVPKLDSRINRGESTKAIIYQNLDNFKARLGLTHSFRDLHRYMKSEHGLKVSFSTFHYHLDEFPELKSARSGTDPLVSKAHVSSNFSILADGASTSAITTRPVFSSTGLAKSLQKRYARTSDYSVVRTSRKYGMYCQSAFIDDLENGLSVRDVQNATAGTVFAPHAERAFRRHWHRLKAADKARLTSTFYGNNDRKKTTKLRARHNGERKSPAWTAPCDGLYEKHVT